MKEFPHKTVILGVLLIVAVVVAIFSVAFYSPSSVPASSDRVITPNYAFQTKVAKEIKVSVAATRRPSWSPVYEERMVDGKVWYAYAKATVRQFKPVRVNDKLSLVNAKGEVIQAKVVQIFNPATRSGPTSPARIWIEFKNLAPARGQPDTCIGVIFKKWGWPPL